MINLTQAKNYFQAHKKIIIIITSLAIIILATILTLPKESSPLENTSTSSSTSFSDLSQTVFDDTTPLPVYTQPALGTDNTIDQSNPQYQKALKTKNKLSLLLPIYFPNFPTSVNLPTTINIYSLPEDPDHLIHLDIYGLNYQNASLNETINPHLTAFKESFLKAKSLLLEKGVNLEDVYFIFGGQQYIQQTAELWIKEFDLL
jgi:hypothetical protein